MNEMLGVLLLRRIRWWAEGRAKKPRDSAVDLPEDQLARRYRGIDGEAWPDELASNISHDNGLARIGNWPALLAIAKERSNGNIYDAIIVAKSPDLVVHGVEFLGFDFGFYDDEYSIFSSIFHEAIHSPLTELRHYAPRLNEALLLATASDAESYRQTRDELRKSGRDVEDEDCYPIAIYGLRACL